MKSSSPVNPTALKSPISVKSETSALQSTQVIHPPIRNKSPVIKGENPYEDYLVTPSSTLSQEIVPLPSYNTSSSFSCTQDAIESVQQDIISLRQSFPPPSSSTQSSNHQVVVSMGSEVRELKKEVMFLVESLQNSMHHKQILERRLSYFEEREENELIKQSQDYDRDKELFKRRYSRKHNFSRHFNPK